MSKQLVTPAPLLTELPFFVFVVGGGILHRPSLFCINYSSILFFLPTTFTLGQLNLVACH